LGGGAKLFAKDILELRAVIRKIPGKVSGKNTARSLMDSYLVLNHYCSAYGMMPDDIEKFDRLWQICADEGVVLTQEDEAYLFTEFLESRQLIEHMAS
jgi:hypothetical protein